MNHRVFPGIGQFQQHFNQLDSINTKRFTFAQSICLLNGRFDWRQKFPRTCFCCASHCSLLNVHNILSQNPTKRWKLNKTRKRCATKLYNWLRIAGCCEEVLLLGWFPVTESNKTIFSGQVMQCSVQKKWFSPTFQSFLDLLCSFHWNPFTAVFDKLFSIFILILISMHTIQCNANELVFLLFSFCK